MGAEAATGEEAAATLTRVARREGRAVIGHCCGLDRAHFFSVQTAPRSGLVPSPDPSRSLSGLV